MPVEFALRPRIRLRDDFATPRRARFRLPRFTFHVLGYWLAIGGATYAFIHSADASREHARNAAAELPPEGAPQAAPPRDWWKPIARASAPAEPELEPAPLPTPPEPARAPEPEPTLALSPRAEPEPQPEPEPRPAPAAPSPALRAFAAAPQPPRTPVAEAPRSPERPSSALRDEVPALPSPAPVAPPAVAAGSFPSCESVIAAASQDIDFAHADRTADLPSSALAAVLENGVWLASCNVPESTKLEVCVAIRGGRVLGASVSARPANGAIAACVRNRASGLRFPYSSHLDVARTRF